MKTKSIEIAVEQGASGEEFPNCYSAIPPNGKVCAFTGLRHTHLYTLLRPGGAARPYVRVVNLREPGATKGKTLFHVGDMFRYLGSLSAEQGSAQLRDRDPT